MTLTTKVKPNVGKGNGKKGSNTTMTQQLIQDTENRIKSLQTELENEVKIILY